MIPETNAEVKEGLITRYNYEISPGKAKLTLYMGLAWVQVTNHVTIGKIIAVGLKLRAGWRSLHPINDPWTMQFTEHGKKLVFVDVRPGKPTPKPDIAARHVPLIDYVSWKGRAMLKIDDPDVGMIFLEDNSAVTACGLEPVPTVTKVEGWSVIFERKAGEVKLIDVYGPDPVIEENDEEDSRRESEYDDYINRREREHLTSVEYGNDDDSQPPDIIEEEVSDQIAEPTPAPIALLPYRTETLLRKMARRPYSKFGYSVLVTLGNTLPAGRHPIHLPGPMPAGLLPARTLTTAPLPRTPKYRRYSRILPAPALIGETRYAITSERWLELDRANRHAVMRALDPLILDAIMYTSGKRTIQAFGAGWEEFRRRMITVRSIVLRDNPNTNPLHKADSEYAKMVAATEAERAAKLKALVRELLGVDIEPTSGEMIMPLQMDGSRFTYQLSRNGSDYDLRVLLWSPALGMNQVAETITTKAQVKTAIDSLWARHNARADRLMRLRAYRDQAVQEYFPEHAQTSTRYVQ